MLLRLVLACALCWTALSLAPSPATAQEVDQFVVNNGARLSFVPLPRGAAVAEVLELTESVTEITFLDDGRLMAVRPIVGDEVFTNMLTRIKADGTVVDVGIIEPADDALFGEHVRDLAVDSAGRLFALTEVSVSWNPPDSYTRLLQLDPDDATILQSHLILDEKVADIARAPQGLWAIAFEPLYHLDPDTGVLTPQTIGGAPVRVGGGGSVADSSGAFWNYTAGVCSPPCHGYRRFDPATGAADRIDHWKLNPEFFTIADFAVKRSCAPSDSALCLQGGRFRAEVTWRDDDGNTGSGRLTAARSADSGVYWFFGAANWELMVKVIEGCDLGGHFWVFTSGSTNVEYTLTVTDLLTDEVQVYENPLGRTALTVTDTAAFACES